MSTPDEAVQQQLAEQAAASAAPPLAEPDLTAATPAAVDIDELRKQLADAEAAQAAAAAAAEVPAEPAAPAAPVLSSGSSELNSVIAQIWNEIIAIKNHLHL